MKVKLLGLQEMDFTPQGEKEPIVGTYIFVAFKTPKVTGLETQKKFISAKIFPLVVMIDLAQFVGKDIDVEMGFNKEIIAITG